MTCWCRLEQWQQAGYGSELHAVLLDKLAQADQLDWSRASLDSTSVPAPHAPKGGHKTLPKRSGPIPQIGASRAPSAMWW